MADIIMKCGCRANGTYNNKPVCAVHFMFDPAKAMEPMDPQPNLEGRKAKCACGAVRDSSLTLAFFEWTPEKEMDRYYCGHAGWD